MRFVVTTAPGLEGLLAEELGELGAAPLETAPGAAIFEGEWSAAARVLVRSRIASRVLVSIRRFSARSEAIVVKNVGVRPSRSHSATIGCQRARPASVMAGSSWPMNRTIG